MGIAFLYVSFILFFGLALYRWRYTASSWKEVLSFFIFMSLVQWLAFFSILFIEALYPHEKIKLHTNRTVAKALTLDLLSLCVLK